jgi:hypothetical protein
MAKPAAGNCTPLLREPLSLRSGKPRRMPALMERRHVPGYINSSAYTNHKVLRAFWTGLRFAIRDNLDLVGAYDHYWQNDYSTRACTTRCSLRHDRLSANRARRRLRWLYVVTGDRGPRERISLPCQVPSRVVLELADASSGGIRLSDHAARSRIWSVGFSARVCQP